MGRHPETEEQTITLAEPTEDAFLAACRGERWDHTPVWFMRQAGRSLPEYRALRESHDILSLCRTPELAAEVTLQPVRRHSVDAAILFSDIVIPLMAMGVDLEIRPGVGPVIAHPIRSLADVERLEPFDAEEGVPFVLETIKILTKELEVPLIGFGGAPFTLASYLIEGGPSKNHSKAKSFMYAEPEAWSALMERLSGAVLAYLEAQVSAGARAVQLFDSWVGSLNPDDYAAYVLPWVRRILEGLAGPDVPRIHFGVHTGELLGQMASAGADVVGIDWRVPLADGRRRVGGLPVQGNLDPVTCLAPWEVIEERVLKILDQGGGRGHIFNLGHGVLPETDPDVLTRIVELVHAWSPPDA
jgi:uroporphyrinogen decarboxylase